MSCKHHKTCGDCFSPATVKRLEKEAETLSTLGIELAYALRLAVTTEFVKERSEALKKWETYVLKRG